MVLLKRSVFFISILMSAVFLVSRGFSEETGVYINNMRKLIAFIRSMKK